jgi:hypothetical protein
MGALLSTRASVSVVMAFVAFVSSLGLCEGKVDSLSAMADSVCGICADMLCTGELFGGLVVLLAFGSVMYCV